MERGVCKRRLASCDWVWQIGQRRESWRYVCAMLVCENFMFLRMVSESGWSGCHVGNVFVVVLKN